ncbi:MAG: NAD(P)-dependent alcohol dehydrogenase [Polyangiaceae bacterium]|nr:NAD(P)-dependent alcohol dehydrogenase [Polyangiaceae bacterium]
MQAFYATAWGGPDVMRHGDLPDPHPGRGEVRVAVQASSINPVDWKVRVGMVRWLPGQHLPRPLGTDFAGVVDEVGKGVSSFRVGDRVYGIVVTMLGHAGAHAEYVNAPVNRLRRMPDGLGFVEAAALPVAALTALNGLRLAGERAAQRVLVNGATGGVGHFAVQMARARGATVTAVCSARNLERARELGAHTVLDYQSQDFTTLEDRYDLVLDAHASAGYSRASRVLEPTGAYASTLPTPALIFRDFASSVLPVGRAYLANMRGHPEDYAELERLLADGSVKPIVEHVYSLADAAKAFALAEAGGVVGKVAVQVR